jgi:transposase
MKHKSPDYKLSAVNYYLNHEVGYDNTCKIFDCKKSSLKRWIHKYKTSKNLTRKNRKPISYKITKPQVNTALELLKQNEQLTMNELAIDMKKKYPQIKSNTTVAEALHIIDMAERAAKAITNA